MKKIVNEFTPPKEEVRLRDLIGLPDSYYGIMTDAANGSMKGFISQDRYEAGPFRIRAIDKITIGNGWTLVPGRSLTGVSFSGIPKSALAPSVG